VLLRDRLLTQQRLHQKGVMVQIKCYLCENVVLETRDHLFSQCSASISFWQQIRSQFNMPPTSLFSTVQETWLNLREFTAETKREMWDTICLSTTWNLWKEQNNRLFRGEHMPLIRLLQHTLMEIEQWSEHCTWQIKW
jgi:zinc-binding in reverse transcriptase